MRLIDSCITQLLEGFRRRVEENARDFDGDELALPYTTLVVVQNNRSEAWGFGGKQLMRRVHKKGSGEKCRRTRFRMKVEVQDKG